MLSVCDDGTDDFGLSSSDEAELVALAESCVQGTKRKTTFDSENPPSKRAKAPIVCPKASQSAASALTRIFGLESFRLKQEEVVSRILAGESATVVFPTGGGKSLCYQIPALVFSELDKLTDTRAEQDSGITLVVSPLIALMKDQVDALVRRGVKAAVLDSTKTREEYLQTSEMLRNGELKLLYCAPERLNNEGFVQQMKYVRGGIRLLAVDEAHCISEWGHAFRPDYLKISRFFTEIKAERVICLTATATPRVAKDICDAFNISEAGLFRTSTYRPNLQLLVESAETKQELYPRLFDFLKNNPGPSIVYVTLQKQAEALAADLRNQKFKAKAFHAGMDTSLKAQLQDEFMNSDDLTMVATIAFGMGIDKANIRNVVHFNIPASLESYSQEIGRAGRDGKLSKCVFYICGEDLHLREMFARGDLPSRKSVRGLLEDILDSKNGTLDAGGEIMASHSRQERDFDMRTTTLKNIYAKLELSHGLLRETTPIYSSYSFKCGATYKSEINSDKSPAAVAIQLHSKVAKTLHHIDISAASTRAGILRADIIRKLKDWDEREVLELKTTGVLSVYKILKPFPRLASEVEKLVDDLYTSMEKHEQDTLARTEEVLRLITSRACFSRSLAQYFGDQLPGGERECGHCTWCLTHQVTIKKVPPRVPFNQFAFNAILRTVQARDDARLLARIAFGIRSPRTRALKISNVLGSMGDHEFMVLLRAFESVCKVATH